MGRYADLREWDIAGRWLQKFRWESDLSLVTLARRIGLKSPGSIHAWEEGRTPVPERYRQPICDALDCQYDDIWLNP